MFHVGQKVVCVDGDFKCPDQHSILPREKGVYTIRAIYREHYADAGWTVAVLLEEVRNPARGWLTLGWHEMGYAADRFRAITERKTDISIFREILRKATKKQPQRA